MRNLITYEEISQLARPCTTDEDMAKAMIAEAQRVEIKPRLGDALYCRLTEEPAEYIVISGGTAEPAEYIVISGGTAEASEAPDVIDSDTEAESNVDSLDPYEILLNGGRWISKNGCVYHLTGVKTALAYYALARIVRDGNIQATTYGTAIKDDQYSSDPEKTERQRQYRELFCQADSYMAEAINYITHNCEAFPEYKVAGKMRSNRMTIRIIGK